MLQSKLARELRIFEGRKGGQEGRPKEETEIEELLIGKTSKLLLTCLLGNPVKLGRVDVNASNQLVDVEQEDFSWSTDGINEGVGSFRKVGQL
jgi:hypothetical protein